VLLIYPAESREGEEFFSRLWPAARAVADPAGRLYEAFGVDRASLRELFGPGVWGRLREARRRGHRSRFPIGNPWLLPGMFLVEGGQVCWQYRYRHIGDKPDLSRLLSADL
jgi:hypothetical protein